MRFGASRGMGRGHDGRRAGSRHGPIHHFVLVVEKEGALVDEGLDDELVDSGGREGIHRLEVWPHERGPKADRQILAGHVVFGAVLAHLVQVSDDVFEDFVVDVWQFL